MKNNWAARLVVLVAVLTLVTASLVSGTFAKYATEVSGTDTVVVAKWNADFGDGDEAQSTTDFNLFDTASDDGVANVSGGGIIAPGTSGTFSVDYNTDGTQVRRDVDIVMGASNLSSLGYLKFYQGTDATGTDITSEVLSGSATLLDETFEANDPGTGTVELYWVWPFASDEAQDIADTADGVAAITNGAVTITFSAVQLDD